MSKIAGTLPKYLEFKTFELFRDRMLPAIQANAPLNSKVDIYKHLFLCAPESSTETNFKIQGVMSPFVCLWRTSPLLWNTDQKLYGRSVLPRKMRIKRNGREEYLEGFYYDLKTTFELFSSSYYKDFRDRVNQDLLDFDRKRYFIYDLRELLGSDLPVATKAELQLEGIRTEDRTKTESGRAFMLSAQFTLRITVPYVHDAGYIERIRVFLEGHKTYEKELNQ